MTNSTPNRPKSETELEAFLEGLESEAGREKIGIDAYEEAKRAESKNETDRLLE